MTSTFTKAKSLEEPANGDYVNTWDLPINNNTTTIDTAFGGNATINVTSASGTTNLTLTQYTPPSITFNGTIGSNLTYQLPGNVGGVWSVFNNSTGNFSLTVSSAGGGRSTTIPQGFRKQIISDAVNVDQTDNTPASPAGNSSWIQFNNAGSLGATASLTWDGANITAPALKLVASSSGYLTFAPPSTVNTPVQFTLPNGDGTNGQVLTTNGSGVLSWGNVSAGSGVTSFNGRQGVVTLTSSDVTSALTYVPVNPASPGNFSGFLSLTVGGNVTLPSGVQASNALGFLGMPLSSRSGNYTAIGNDTAQLQMWTAAGNFTIPPNSSVAYPTGTILPFGTTTGNLGVKCTDTLTFLPSGGTGNRTATGPALGFALKVASTQWFLYGMGLA